MAVVIPDIQTEIKKIHYFRKEHLNYYQSGALSNASSMAITLNETYTESNAENFNADGIHFFNITADATLKDSNNVYNFYSCNVSTRGRTLLVELPESVTGTLFVKVSFDVYYYTIEENE